MKNKKRYVAFFENIKVNNEYKNVQYEQKKFVDAIKYYRKK